MQKKRYWTEKQIKKAKVVDSIAFGVVLVLSVALVAAMLAYFVRPLHSAVRTRMCNILVRIGDVHYEVPGTVALKAIACLEENGALQQLGDGTISAAVGE